MMRRLIICETPNFAKFIMSCIKEEFISKYTNNSSYPTYFQSPNYYITYAKGALFETWKIEDYYKDDKKDILEILPFYPENNNFFYKLKQVQNASGKKITDPFVKLQFLTINELIKLPDTELIIHCGEPSYEGEVVIRQIINNCKAEKPVKRLWLKSKTFDFFEDAINSMKNDSVYDNYAEYGNLMLKIDYLYGQNMSKYLTYKIQKFIDKPIYLDRVMGTMLNVLYVREKEIEGFIPESYYYLLSDYQIMGVNLNLRCDRTYSIYEYELALEHCGINNQKEFIVKDIVTKQEIKETDKLFSYVTLYNYISENLNITIFEAERIIQKLFDEGYITYPKTNTEYLSTREKEYVEKIIESYCKNGFGLKIKNDIFDDEKIEMHGAICPTLKKIENLNEEETKIYEIIRNRFISVFCDEDCVVEHTDITIAGEEIEFKVKNEKIIQKGFMKYETKKIEGSTLPPLEKGGRIKTNFMVYEGKTPAPERYTITSYNLFLENPYFTINDSNDEKYNNIIQGLELGTVLNRISIIKQMVMLGYIEIKDQKYYVTSLGKYIMESLYKLDIVMDIEKTTASFQMLKRVMNKEINEDDVLNFVKKDIKSFFSKREVEITNNLNEKDKQLDLKYKEIIGNCPVCGEPVYETENKFSCSNPRGCDFILYKNDTYIKSITKKELSSSMVRTLLEKGSIKVSVDIGENKEYEIILRIKMTEDEKIIWEKYDYIGECPICGGRVKITPYFYICENNKNKEECFFILYRNDKFIKAHLKREIDINLAQTLLKNNCFLVGVNKKNKAGKFYKKFCLNYNFEEKKINWKTEIKN